MWLNKFPNTYCNKRQNGVKYSIKNVKEEKRMTKLMPESPVSLLSGVGPTREKQLWRLGIFTLRDLVYKAEDILI